MKFSTVASKFSSIFSGRSNISLISIVLLSTLLLVSSVIVLVVVIVVRQQPLSRQVSFVQPSRQPSIAPSLFPPPTSLPSSLPTGVPTGTPSSDPTIGPTVEPSLYPTEMPTTVPTVEPSLYPTWVPSLVPTVKPTLNPTEMPTILPTLEPSSYPTSKVPTWIPSSMTWSPSEMYYFPMDVTPHVPENNASYFTYNPNDLNFGPGRAVQDTFIYNQTIMINNSTTVNQTKVINYTKYEGNQWQKVRNSYESNYWKEFDMQRTMDNRCSSDPWRTQSPIDLCPDVVNAECFEHHQIRMRGGDYNLDDAEVTLKILPSKLRIEYSRENANLTESLLRPPHADFAHNWNGYISAVHIDIKIPSEHTICGKRFAGEYQIYFYHPNRKQPIVLSVLMEIHPNERPHLHFQRALNEWQILSDERKMSCWNQARKEREAQEIFKRRMDNVLKTHIDSHEVSWRKDHGLDVDHSSHAIHANEQSTILDEPEIERKHFQKKLRYLKKRASHPVFEEKYYDNNIDAGDIPSSSDTQSHRLRRRTTTADDSSIPLSSFENQTTVECKDSEISFVFQGINITCQTLNSSHLQNYSTCEKDAVLREFCPSTCGICPKVPEDASFNNHNNNTHSPSSAPSSAPTRVKWNPFQPRIINSIYFYGYGGSLTEPPCSEWVAWRVLDKPMQISTAQWNQMRNILFQQVDGDCKRTSVHWNGSVARPIQSLNDRPLWRCTRDDYLSDVERRQISSP